MLVEDVANGLVPYSRSEDFSFSIEPTSVDVERIIAEGLGRDGYGRDLLGAVRDFLRDAVQTLLAFGDAPYEIVYYRADSTDRKPRLAAIRFLMKRWSCSMTLLAPANRPGTGEIDEQRENTRLTFINAMPDLSLLARSTSDLEGLPISAGQR